MARALIVDAGTDLSPLLEQLGAGPAKLKVIASSSAEATDPLAMRS